MSFYVSAVALIIALEVALEVLNMRRVARGAARLPAVVESAYTPEMIARAAAYSRDKARLAIASSIANGIGLLMLVASGALGAGERWIAARLPAPYLSSIAAVLGCALVFSLLQLPFSYFSNFVIEARYGLNAMTRARWALDHLIGLALSLVIALPLITALVWFWKVSGAWWWLAAAAVTVGVQVILAAVYPTWIAPLFNTFTALEPGETRDRIIALARRLGIEPRALLVMDGSKRSRHANAYFAGIGTHKRIVLFDTLLQLLGPAEVEAVLAHEGGHLKLKHIAKSLALGALATAAILWLLQHLCTDPAVVQTLGFDTPRPSAVLILIAYVFSPFLIVVSPLFAAISRAHEYEADRFALHCTGSARPMSEALVRLSTRSLSNLNPHPWYSFFHYSHPTLVERIRALEDAERGVVRSAE